MNERCPACGGSGVWEDFAPGSSCPHCGGSGTEPTFPPASSSCQFCIGTAWEGAGCDMCELTRQLGEEVLAAFTSEALPPVSGFGAELGIY